MVNPYAQRLMYKGKFRVLGGCNGFCIKITAYIIVNRNQFEFTKYTLQYYKGTTKDADKKVKIKEMVK